MLILAPSIFAADYIHLERQLAVMENQGVNRIHIDIMDGNFVPSLSFGPDFVANIRPYSDFYFDVHLMVTDPAGLIKEFADAGADGITVHHEIFRNDLEIERALDEIHSFGKIAGIALKPKTGIEMVTSEIWNKIDLIQLMTVEPGLRGQRFIPDSLAKISKARKITGILEKSQGRYIDIETDGDITTENLESVLKAGANCIVVGKGLFEGDLKDNLKTYCGLMEHFKDHTAFRGEKICST